MALRAIGALLGVTLVGLLVALGGAVAAGTVAGSDQQESTKIAFACSGDICAMNADGTGQRQLTREKFRFDSYPAWPPEGRRIVFTSNLGGRTVLYVMNADGSGRQLLTPSRGDDALATWSPDGKTIAFDDNVSSEIDLMNADGSARRPLTARPASLPAWSPNGKQIAFVSGDGRKIALTSGDIYAINVNGSGQRLLTRNGTFPVWSPDGTKIVFLRNKRSWSKQVGVWIMNSDGSGKRRIWSHSAEGGGLSWSPDGTRISLTNEDGIGVINADGHPTRQLTRGWRADNDPAWQPRPFQTRFN